MKVTFVMSVVQSLVMIFGFIAEMQLDLRNCLIDVCYILFSLKYSYFYLIISFFWELCVCMRACVQTCADVCGGQNRISDPLELDLQLVLNHLSCMLGRGFTSSAKTPRVNSSAHKPKMLMPLVHVFYLVHSWYITGTGGCYYLELVNFKANSFSHRSL